MIIGSRMLAVSGLAVQNVVIDVTGQTISDAQRQQIYDQIVQKSNGIIPQSQVEIVNNDN